MHHGSDFEYGCAVSGVVSIRQRRLEQARQNIEMASRIAELCRLPHIEEELRLALDSLGADEIGGAIEGLEHAASNLLQD